MLIIGVTGGSGSGKTTLLAQARLRGGLTLDCDELYHTLLSSCPALLLEIEREFPGSVISGVLARKKLGKLVFDDPEALARLNALTHRYVISEVRSRLAAQPDAPFVVIDAIGLLESELAALCAVTVAVTAPARVRVTRLMAREGVTEDYAVARIRAQKPDAYYTDACTYTINNDYPTAAAFAQAAGSLLDRLIAAEKEKLV